MTDAQRTVCDRLVIRGKLSIPHALHIGSGEWSRQSDAPIRRDRRGQPYIPGSTLAGLLRTTARDLAPYLLNDRQDAVENLFGRAGGREDENNASRVIVEDASICAKLPPDTSEVREHVGMDRSTGAARRNFQYDQEVAPSGTSYSFGISVEDPTQDDIRLVLAVLDFWSEFDFALHIGGGTTTGLGEARLEKDLDFYRLRFGDPEILLDYLTGGRPDEDYLPEAAKVARTEIEPANPAPLPSAFQYAEAFRPQHLILSIALTPEEPVLVQGPLPEIPESDTKLYGRDRVSDADFVTAVIAPADEGCLPSEQPYIPGSSLKGLLRTRAERLVRTLNYYRDDDPEHYADRICACAITHAEDDTERLSSCFGTSEKQRRTQEFARNRFQGEDLVFAEELYKSSCVTCRTFGNSMMRGRLNVSDARLTTASQMKLFDHVAIDRFHGGAADKRKFDDRPLMPQVTVDEESQTRLFQPMFLFRLHLERPEPWMLGLLGHLLKDLKTADMRVGSRTRRGYGKVRGSITQSELLILPGSKLWDLCEDFPKKEGPKPYWQVDLELPLLFERDRWGDEGLAGPVLQNPTAKLLQTCDERFQALVEAEEKKPHGQLRGVERFDR